jgi:Tfp pilus assembly protein PilP
VNGKPAVAVAAKPVVVAHPGAVAVHAKVATPASKLVAAKTPFNKPAVAVPAKAPAANVVSVQDNKSGENKKPEVKKINAAGRRDPFVSPVVNLGAVGSGCSSGKRCLAIDQIALKGVVRSDNGMIAVVVNAMDKAYFLRENDPVFDGYVVKITGDSIVFKETFKDKLGKPLTRDVTKTISRPAA